MQSCDDISSGNNLFLLSLSKKVEDLKEKEELSNDTIEYLSNEYPDSLKRRNVHFNIDSIKFFLRKRYINMY